MLDFVEDDSRYSAFLELVESRDESGNEVAIDNLDMNIMECFTGSPFRP